MIRNLVFAVSLAFFSSFSANAAIVVSAPSNLSATVASQSQINLAWTDGSNNETGFYIERATSSSGPFAVIATVGSNIVRFSNTGLSQGTYFYRVRAYVRNEGYFYSAYTPIVSATLSTSSATPTPTPAPVPTATPRPTATPTPVPTASPTPSTPVPSQVSAFPSAVGPGASSVGGRNGRVIYITNLNDSGAGSFRDCMAVQTGPRVCIPRVGGVIKLLSPVMIRAANSYVSFLGQAAPGGGILLTADPVLVKSTAFLLKGANDVVIRHLRVRYQFPNTLSQTGDNLLVENSKRVYIDHFSGSWSIDEGIDVYKNTNDITIAYSTFGEGLKPHSKCVLMSDDTTVTQNIYFWRNMCVTNNDRNPQNDHVPGSCIVNAENIFYNPKSQFAEVWSTNGGTDINFIGNMFKAGPSTNSATNAIDWETLYQPAPLIYQWGNKTFAPSGKAIMLIAADTVNSIVPSPRCNIEANVYWTENGVRTGMNANLYQHVRSQAGAFPRDSVDQRYYNEVGAWNIAGTTQGGMLSVAPPLPSIGNATPYADKDADGMPDSLEAARGAVVGVQDQWKTTTNGWTYFDLVMQDLAARRISGQYAQ